MSARAAERGPTRPSSMCDRGDHAFCQTSQARCNCRCHGRHGQLPPTAPSNRKEPTMPPTPLKSVPTLAVPGVGLVRSDPPPKRSYGVTAQICALVPQVEAEPGVWFQVASWKATSSAGSARQTLAAKFPAIKWEARRLPGGGSGLWAKAEP